MAVDKRVHSEIETQLTLRFNRFDVHTQWRSRFKNVCIVLIFATIKPRTNTGLKSTPQCLNFKFASIPCASYALNDVEI
eukprot:85835-Pleurochrysis_carterae.AAC.1